MHHASVQKENREQNKNRKRTRQQTTSRSAVARLPSSKGGSAEPPHYFASSARKLRCLDMARVTCIPTPSALSVHDISSHRGNSKGPCWCQWWEGPLGDTIGLWVVSKGGWTQQGPPELLAEESGSYWLWLSSSELSQEVCKYHRAQKITYIKKLLCELLFLSGYKYNHTTNPRQK